MLSLALRQRRRSSTSPALRRSASSAPGYPGDSSVRCDVRLHRNEHRLGRSSNLHRHDCDRQYPSEHQDLLVGSVGGIIVLTQNFPVPDAAEGVSGGWLANSTPQSTTGTGGANAANIDPAVTADVTFSDSFQSSTIVPTPALTGANGLRSGVVGVIAFQWVAGNGDPATITNITNQVAQQALFGGLPLSQLTGFSADEGTLVEVFGRDSDSCTLLRRLPKPFSEIHVADPIPSDGHRWRHYGS